MDDDNDLQIFLSHDMTLELINNLNKAIVTSHMEKRHCCVSMQLRTDDGPLVINVVVMKGE